MCKNISKMCKNIYKNKGYLLKTFQNILENYIFSFKIVHFRLHLFQKHIYLYMEKIA